MKISEYRLKLWMGFDKEGKRRYKVVRHEMRRYVTKVKLYCKTEYGKQQWTDFVTELINLQALAPVRPYFQGPETEDNKPYRVALDKIMTDVMKKMRGGFKKIHGRYPQMNEDIDPSALKLDEEDREDNDEDGGDEEEDNTEPFTYPKTPRGQKRERPSKFVLSSLMEVD
jgi:hypothetical protein